ncbi:MAG: alpha/beta hydrolase [Candidatus Heimdallarchaeaceae archaeon]
MSTKEFAGNNVLPAELTVTKEIETKIDNMIEAAKRKVPNFWEIDECSTIYVPVDDGEIRVLHIKPKNPITKRPLVFIPGWGGLVEGYTDFYQVLHEKVEFYFLETREKKSSKLNRKTAKMDMNQKAKDVQDVINYLGLEKQDFVLFGTCWGGAIILHGLIENIIQAPTLVANDPMHYFIFPKWLLNYVAPITPVFFANLIKPILKYAQIRDMKAKVQKQRTALFIDSAEAWKWKKAAVAVKDFELFGKLSVINEEVFVTNGTQDKIHNQIDYPLMAKEMPNGRFIFMKTVESKREYMMGLIALEFCKVTKEARIPPSLAEFEKKLDR